MNPSPISSSLFEPTISCVLCYEPSSLCFAVDDLLYIICDTCILSSDIKVLVVDNGSDTIIYCVLVVEGRHVVLFSGEDKPDFKSWASSVDVVRQYLKTLKVGLRKLNSDRLTTDLGE